MITLAGNNSTSLETRILVVDDNSVNRKVFEKQIKHLKLNCKVVESGYEAVNAIKENPNSYKVILLDINMVGMDGFETCKKIRELDLEKKYHIYSTSANNNDLEKLEIYGFDGSLPKPIPINKLKTLLQNHYDIG